GGPAPLTGGDHQHAFRQPLTGAVVHVHDHALRDLPVEHAAALVLWGHRVPPDLPSHGIGDLHQTLSIRDLHQCLHRIGDPLLFFPAPDHLDDVLGVHSLSFRLSVSDSTGWVGARQPLATP